MLSVVVGDQRPDRDDLARRYSPLAEPHEPPKFALVEGDGRSTKGSPRQKVEEEAEKAEKTPKKGSMEKNREGPIAAAANRRQTPLPQGARPGSGSTSLAAWVSTRRSGTSSTIENRGKAPLLLAKGPTNCKCTISSISTEGGSARRLGRHGNELDAAGNDEHVREDGDRCGRTIPSFPRFSSRFSAKWCGSSSSARSANWHAGHVTDVQDGAWLGIVASGIDPNFKIVSVDIAQSAT